MSIKANKQRRDAWTAEQLAKAVQYTAVMFLGHPYGIDKRYASSLKEARQIKQEMLTEYAGKNYGRGVMIYATTIDNMTIYVE